MNKQNTDTAVAMAAGATLAKPQQIDGLNYVVVPDDYHIESLDRFQSAPPRINSTMEFSDADSFVRYLNKFKTEHSVIYYSDGNAKFIGIINANSIEGPSHEDHRAEYTPILSRQFNAWDSADDIPMSQTAFTSFIEKKLIRYC